MNLLLLQEFNSLPSAAIKHYVTSVSIDKDVLRVANDEAATI